MCIARIGGSYRVSRTGSTVGTNQARLRRYVLDQAPAFFTLADIRRALPGVSDQTIHLVLATLRMDGAVESQGTGRSATWRRLGA